MPPPNLESINKEGGAPANTIDDSCTAIVPTGEWLDGRFRIDQLLKRGTHADVYLVSDQDTTSLGATVSLEARAFSLLGISQHHKSYRIRAMKRLSSRSIHKTKWNDLDIIVYKTDGLNKLPSNDTRDVDALSHDLEALIINTDNVSHTGDTFPGDAQGHEDVHHIPREMAVKTEYKRESERLRQRDRRQSRRLGQKTTIQNGSNDDAADRSIADEYSWIDHGENTSPMLILLQIARPELRNLRPRSRIATFDYYLSMKDAEPAFTNGEEMEEFAQIKQQEIVYLRRLVGKVEAASIHLQRLHPRELQVGTEIQINGIEPIEQQLKVLQPASGLLSDLIFAAKERHRSISQRLYLRSQEEGGMQYQQNRRDMLSKKMENFAVWKYYVLPGSDVYIRLVSEYKTARLQFEDLEQEIKKRKRKRKRKQQSAEPPPEPA